MRTTLDLTDEAYQLAKSIARDKNIGLGKAVSEIIVDFANPIPRTRKYGEIYLEKGIPVISMHRVITSEQVAALLDESE
jgi:hypothetical protein